MRPPAQAFAWLFIAGTILSACSAHPEPDAEPFPYTVEPRAYSASVKHVSDRVHGVIMALTVTLILPLGGLSWRLLGRVVSSRSLLWFHICCQSLGLGMLVVGFSCGVWSAFTHAEVSTVLITTAYPSRDLEANPGLTCQRSMPVIPTDTRSSVPLQSPFSSCNQLLAYIIIVNTRRR